MQPSASPSRLISFFPVLVGFTVVAYLVYTGSWVVHNVRGGAWSGWLERIYLAAFVAWVICLAATLWAKRRIKSDAYRGVADERTAELMLRAHRIALVVILLIQLPFFFFTVPSAAMAQFTVTTGVVALFVSYAWLDR